MPENDLLARLAGWLIDAGIPHMIVGSTASSFHGEPRTTRDVDIVIDPTTDALHRFLDSIPRTDFYVDADQALIALERRTSFNLIEHATGWKVDLLICRDRPFSREELRRRIAVRLLGTDTFIATAEDTILAKLEWAATGESERQINDVAGILAASAATLDRAYLDRWIRELGLADTWDRARRLVPPA